jgi:hypothetical protein
MSQEIMIVNRKERNRVSQGTQTIVIKKFNLRPLRVLS